MSLREELTDITFLISFSNSNSFSPTPNYVSCFAPIFSRLHSVHAVSWPKHPAILQDPQMERTTEVKANVSKSANSRVSFSLFYFSTLLREGRNAVKFAILSLCWTKLSLNQSLVSLKH